MPLRSRLGRLERACAVRGTIVPLVVMTTWPDGRVLAANGAEYPSMEAAEAAYSHGALFIIGEVAEEVPYGPFEISS
jgi:hypothetical protein